MKGQKGFTLIELMIVVAIIGVLSAIAIPAYKDYVAKSEMASAMATMKALVTPAELVIQETGEISGGLATLGTSAGANTLGTIAIATSTSAANLTFKFANGSLKTQGISLQRSNEGWTCKHNTTIDVKGCNEDSTLTIK